jgi:hypothetical protein
MSSKLGLAVCLLVCACSPESRASATEVDGQNSKAELDKAMEADPDAGAIFLGFKQSFPEHYEDIKRQVLNAMTRGASLEEAKEIGRDAMQSFVKANRRNMAVAPAADLVAYAQAQVQLLETMQRDDVQMCAKYSMGDRSPSVYISPPVRRATSKAAVTMIRAARHGIDDPVDRLFQTISDEDASALGTAITRQNVPESLIGLMADERGLAQASPTQQCASGVINARAIASLPSETLARVIAFMLTQ